MRTVLAAALVAGLLAAAATAASGDLDASFGTGGIATADLGYNETGVGAVLQTDGKIVVAGSAFLVAVKGFMLTRFNTDGSLDTGFGAGGKVHTHAYSHIRTRAVALQADGKIVVAGSIYDFGSDFLLVRYLPNGAVDPSFGVGGTVITSFDSTERARALAIQNDGKIVAVGDGGDFKVARYMPDGSLDPSFDGDGRVVIDFAGRSDSGLAVAVRKDGRIVIGGTSRVGADPCPDIALAEINADGSLDTSFGTDGRVLTDLGGEDYANKLAIDANGLIVAGETWACPSRNAPSAVVLRYTDDGVLDPGFADAGIARIDFGAGVAASARGVALQSNGRIVVSGGGGTPWSFAVTRLNVDGTLDASFSADGKATAVPGGEARDVMIQRDGKILVGGGASSDLAVARFEGDPPGKGCRRSGICP